MVTPAGFGIIIREDDGTGVPEVNWPLLSRFIEHLSLRLSRGPIRQRVGNVVIDERLFAAAARGRNPLTDRAGGIVDEKAVWQRIREISRAADMAVPLFSGDKEAVLRWFTTKNSYFFNNTPVEVIFLGNASSLIEMLSERLGG